MGRGVTNCVGLGMSPAGVGRLDSGKEVSRGRFKWGGQGLSQDCHKVREGGQWVVEKKLVRSDPHTLARQPA